MAVTGKLRAMLNEASDRAKKLDSEMERSVYSAPPTPTPPLTRSASGSATGGKLHVNSARIADLMIESDSLPMIDEMMKRQELKESIRSIEQNLAFAKKQVRFLTEKHEAALAELALLDGVQIKTDEPESAPEVGSW